MINNHVFRAPTLKEAIAKAHKNLGPMATITDMHSVGKTEDHLQLYEVHARGVLQSTPRVLHENTGPSTNGFGEDETTSTVRSPQEITNIDIHRKLQDVLLEVGILRDSAHQWTQTAKACEQLRTQLSSLQNHMAGANLSNATANGKSMKIDSTPDNSSPIQLVHDRTRLDPVANAISSALTYTPPVWLRQGPTRVALVGPAGAGKTATLFKIAGVASMRHQLSVSIITLDVHRPGREKAQSEIANLLGIPHHTLRNSKDLPAMLKILSHVDLVLIDTPGESVGGVSAANPLLESLAKAEVEIHLVVPANWSAHILQRLMAVYKGHSAKSVIATRVDESRDLQDLVHALCYSGLPLSALSLGADTTGVIHAANPKILEKHLTDNVGENIAKAAGFAG